MPWSHFSKNEVVWFHSCFPLLWRINLSSLIVIICFCLNPFYFFKINIDTLNKSFWRALVTLFEEWSCLIPFLFPFTLAYTSHVHESSSYVFVWIQLSLFNEYRHTNQNICLKCLGRTFWKMKMLDSIRGSLCVGEYI